MSSLLPKFLRRGRRRQQRAFSHAEARRAARTGDEGTRADLAAREDLKPELLYYLAEDSSANVRRAVAANPSTPRQADLLLTKDGDEGVRTSLAQKIVHLAPKLDRVEQERLRRMTAEALSALARDQATRVREVLAEALKAVADAPPDVIRRLAWDVEAAVATPVLRFSPVLTDQDLIEIIRKQPSAGAVAAIAQRATLSAPVSDAVVETEEIEAVAFLLGNPSAQIREETLDRVIDRAVDIEQWHAPLAMRPRLRSTAAAKIALFVASDILKRMVARDDLDAEVVEAVRAVVDRRLTEEEPRPAPGGTVPARGKGVAIDVDDAFDEAARRWAAGDLDQAAVLDAIRAGRGRHAMAMIAVMADLPLPVVERAISRQSAKGCMALAWRAGLDAATGLEIQRRLARLPASKLLRPEGDGFPLSEQDLAWQIEFVSGL